MRKIKAIVGLAATVCLCAAYAAPSAMAEASEFTNVGHQVKATGGETAFAFGETAVICGSNKGAGEVASAETLKLEVKYEKCEAFFGKEERVSGVKVTPCNLNFHSEDTVALEKGCVIGAKVLGLECVVEPATGSESHKEVLYDQPTKEEGVESEQEMEAFEGVTGIKYKVNKVCESAGVRGSEEGKVTSTLAEQVQGMGDGPLRVIFVAGARPNEQREVTLENTNEQMFKFPPNNKSISCRRMIWTFSTGFPSIPFRSFITLRSECKSNIFEIRSAPVTATLRAEKCIFMISVARGRLIPAGQPGLAELLNQTEPCVFTATMTNEAREDCEVIFPPGQWPGGGLTLRNDNVNRTVEVTFPATPATWFHYTLAARCPSTVASGTATHGTLEGANVLKASFRGVAQTVEIR